MHRKLVILGTALLPLVVVMCSESTDGVSPVIILGDATTADTGVAIDDDGSVSANDASMSSDSTLVFGDASVLLNELSPSDEWVEVVAIGNTAIDLSGFRVADSEKDDGGPKLDEAATFPPGTILSPKAYAIVQGGGIDGGVGVPCPDGGQSYCVNAQFGISNKNGETIYLVDPKGVIVGVIAYPPKAAGDGETWGRIPNADPNGTFVSTTPTPGAANTTP